MGFGGESFSPVTKHPRKSFSLLRQDKRLVAPIQSVDMFVRNWSRTIKKCTTLPSAVVEAGETCSPRWAPMVRFECSTYVTWSIRRSSTKILNIIPCCVFPGTNKIPTISRLSPLIRWKSLFSMFEYRAHLSPVWITIDRASMELPGHRTPPVIFAPLVSTLFDRCMSTRLLVRWWSSSIDLGYSTDAPRDWRSHSGLHSRRGDQSSPMEYDAARLDRNLF